MLHYVLRAGGLIACLVHIGEEFVFCLQNASPEVALGNGNPPLILDADVNLGALGAGVAYPAADPISFSGKYGVSFTQS